MASLLFLAFAILGVIFFGMFVFIEHAMIWVVMSLACMGVAIIFRGFGRY